MDMRPEELRVFGCLLEKQRTTPDAYPLTLNALRLACNQATAREPVVRYDDDVVREAVHRLERRGLARLASGAGSRAPKFRHLADQRLPMDEREQAVMCVLMLRGDQTPGELKQRTERLHAFAHLDGVLATLDRLIERELVVSLPRRPAQKEQRYAHRLGTAPDTDGAPAAPGATSVGPSPPAAPARQSLLTPADETVAALEQRVARLEVEVAALREALGG